MASATGSGNAKVTLPTDEQILITRVFNARRALLWRAYTTPELVKRWWGGQRGQLTTCEIDLRVGGAWRYVLATSHGFEMTFHGEFRDIEAEQRVVFTELFEMPGAGTPTDVEPTVNTATFTEADGRTTFELLIQAPSTELRDTLLSSGMEAGVQEHLDVLERLVASLR